MTGPEDSAEEYDDLDEGNPFYPEEDVLTADIDPFTEHEAIHNASGPEARRPEDDRE